MTSRVIVHAHPPARVCTHHGHMHDAQPRPGRLMTRARPAGGRAGTLGGSNRLLSARDVAAILAVPERTVRDKWREWGLPAYRIGRHLRWRERDLYAWIDRQGA
jgi:excisionase family DNA binding protein